VRVKVTGRRDEHLPALRVRLVKARARDGRPLGDGGDSDTVDATLRQGTEACIAS
jgi:hypothetical protein